MQGKNYITIITNRKKIVLSVNSIIYINMRGKIAEVHISNGKVFETRMPLAELESLIGPDFIKANRGCIVAARAIHSITSKINLNNGEQLDYTIRKKNSIIQQFNDTMRSIVNDFDIEGVPSSRDEYQRHYASFNNLPFAFADIEMIFNDEHHAVDWVFRYGNQALSDLEGVPLDKLVNHSFGSLFSNMDSKWLSGYERATLGKETIELVDYSPEIDTYLKIICFPTFEGHCGCILFDINKIQYIKTSDKASRAMALYMQNIIEEKDQ